MGVRPMHKDHIAIGFIGRLKMVLICVFAIVSLVSNLVFKLVLIWFYFVIRSKTKLKYQIFALSQHGRGYRG